MDRYKQQWEIAKSAAENRDGFWLSPYYAQAIDEDIKHLMFVFARYKFVSKMLANRENLNILELGCNHGLGTKFFRQSRACNKIVGVDFDGSAIQWARENFADEKTTFIEADFLNQSFIKENKNEKFDTIVSIDVIEHVDKKHEAELLCTIDTNLKENGFAIFGTPNIAMNPYASTASKLGHINLYDQKRLYTLLNSRFHNVFIFGMNDEVLHTGFYPMSCYIMALCSNKK